MQLPDELNSKRQDPEDEYKTKMYQSKVISTSWSQDDIKFQDNIFPIQLSLLLIIKLFNIKHEFIK